MKRNTRRRSRRRSIPQGASQAARASQHLTKQLKRLSKKTQSTRQFADGLLLNLKQKTLREKVRKASTALRQSLEKAQKAWENLSEQRKKEKADAVMIAKKAAHRVLLLTLEAWSVSQSIHLQQLLDVREKDFDNKSALIKQGLRLRSVVNNHATQTQPPSDHKPHETFNSTDFDTLFQDIKTAVTGYGHSLLREYEEALESAKEKAADKKHQKHLLTLNHRTKRLFDYYRAFADTIWRHKTELMNAWRKASKHLCEHGANTKSIQEDQAALRKMEEKIHHQKDRALSLELHAHLKQPSPERHAEKQPDSQVDSWDEKLKRYSAENKRRSRSLITPIPSPTPYENESKPTPKQPTDKLRQAEIATWTMGAILSAGVAGAVVTVGILGSSASVPFLTAVSNAFNANPWLALYVLLPAAIIALSCLTAGTVISAKRHHHFASQRKAVIDDVFSRHAVRN